jgi:hypothetical protein
MIGWLGWTASSIPTHASSVPAGPVTFDLRACVQALFTIKLPEQPQQDQQAA